VRDYSESLTRILQFTSLQVSEEKMFIVNLKTSLLKCIDTYDDDCISTHLIHICFTFDLNVIFLREGQTQKVY